MAYRPTPLQSRILEAAGAANLPLSESQYLVATLFGGDEGLLSVEEPGPGGDAYRHAEDLSKKHPAHRFFVWDRNPNHAVWMYQNGQRQTTEDEIWAPRMKEQGFS